MKTPVIPVCEPVLGEKELEYASEAIRSGAISGTFGKYIGLFEERFAAYNGVNYGISTTSGSTALHLALATLGIKPRDEVIVSALTNIASAYCVAYLGAKPIFVDSEPDTWNLDTSQLESKITSRTRAIIPVHIYGHPVEMQKVMEIARRHKLHVVEDVAEAHGAESHGQKAGSFGDLNCFSFYANKILTTGEGGMILTNNAEWAQQARLLRNLAFSPKKRFTHEFIGYNYRMSNLHAAIGLAQTERLAQIVEMKRQVARQYHERLHGIPGLRLPAEKPWAKNVYWMYGIVVEDEFGISRDVLAAKLKEEGIETRDFFLPLNRQPIFLQMGLVGEEDRCPVAEELGERGLYLPSGAGLKPEAIERVCDTLRRLQKHADRPVSSMNRI